MSHLFFQLWHCQLAAQLDYKENHADVQSAGVLMICNSASRSGILSQKKNIISPDQAIYMLTQYNWPEEEPKIKIFRATLDGARAIIHKWCVTGKEPPTLGDIPRYTLR